MGPRGEKTILRGKREVKVSNSRCETDAQEIDGKVNGIEIPQHTLDTVLKVTSVEHY